MKPDLLLWFTDPAGGQYIRFDGYRQNKVQDFIEAFKAVSREAGNRPPHGVIHVKSGKILDPSKTLGESGVKKGDVLILVPDDLAFDRAKTITELARVPATRQPEGEAPTSGLWAHVKKLVLEETLKLIFGILVAVIVAYLIYHFGWK